MKISNTTKIVLGTGAAIMGFMSYLSTFKKKEETNSTGSHSGETWHYVYTVYPDIPGVDAFNALSKNLETLTKLTGDNIVEIETPGPNTLDITVKYKTKPSNDMNIGEQLDVGGYTIQLTEKDRVS